MPRKKAANATQTRADVLDKIFAQVDPEVMAAGVLGAIAVYGGVTPPLTRLLASFARQGARAVDDDYIRAANESARDQALINDYHKRHGQAVTGSYDWTTMPTDATDDEAAAFRRRNALMASGAMEGMMMMTLMKNKELMNKLYDTGKDIGAAIIRAAGEAVPF